MQIRNLRDCPRCKGNHPQLLVENLPESAGHWAACPTTGAPILIDLDAIDVDQDALEAKLRGVIFTHLVDPNSSPHSGESLLQLAHAVRHLRKPLEGFLASYEPPEPSHPPLPPRGSMQHGLV